MTIREALVWATAQLKKAGIDSPALDAEQLLDYVVSSPSPQSSPIKGEEAKKKIPSPLVGEGRVRGRAWILAHPEYNLTRGQMQRFKNLVARRARREPVAYILGHKEFYGLDFRVNRRVMVPRPESELLVEQAVRAIRYSLLDIRNLIAVDVGTGSGCIIIALAKLLSNSQLFATDISRSALAVARANAERHGVAKRITFLRGNLLDPLKQKLSITRGRAQLTTLSHLIVTANLPYLPTTEWRGTQPEVRRWEPRGALDGGKDGLKCYREMFHQLQSCVTRYTLQVTCFCEMCSHQIPAFKKLVRRYFPRATVEARQHIAVVRILL